MGHPSIDELRAYVQARMGGAERAGVEAHVQACRQCAERLDLIEAALAASAAAPEPLTPPWDEVEDDGHHRPLSGNDHRLEAALRAGHRVPARPAAPRPARSRATMAALAGGLAVAAGLLLFASRGEGPADPGVVGAPSVVVTLEGPGGATRGIGGPATSGLVLADAIADVAPGQGARLVVSSPVEGWLHVVALDASGARVLPGLPAGGLPLEAGVEVTVPPRRSPPWKASGEPGDIVLALVFASRPVEDEALLSAAAQPDPWSALEVLGEGPVLRTVLRYGGEGR